MKVLRNDKLKLEIEQQKPELNVAIALCQDEESDLSSFDKELKSIEQKINLYKMGTASLKRKISEVEAQYKDVGAPSQVVKDYKQTIASHNKYLKKLNESISKYNAVLSNRKVLYAKYKADLDSLNGSIDIHNSKIERANALSKEIGGPMIFVVVPKRGR